MGARPTLLEAIAEVEARAIAAYKEALAEKVRALPSTPGRAECLALIEDPAPEEAPRG